MKILIVDDEKLIRKGIEAIIKEKFRDDLEILTARNGQEALEIISNRKPEIMITDIKMPIMNGLDLLKNISDKKININCIVLSGYADFNFAQKCIDFGVKNYVLKPIDPVKLQKTVEEVYREAIKNIKNQEESIELYITKLEHVLDNKTEDENKIKELIQKLNFDGDFYQGIVIKSEKEEILEFLNEEDMIVLNRSDFSYIIVKDKNIYDKLKEQEFFIGITEISENIYKIFGQLKNLQRHTLLYKRVVKYEEVVKRDNKENDNNEIDHLKNYLFSGNINYLTDKLEEILSDNFFESKSIEIIEETLLRFKKRFLIPIISKYEKEYIEVIGKVGELKNCKDFSAVRNWYLEFAKGMSMLINDENQLEKQYITKAKEYIEGHYADDLTMAVVSNYIDLNYSYFSTLFKKYTGKKFLDYLNFIRVKKSEKLLLDFELKIYEIAEMVGYKNAKHYMKMFKKFENMTPSEYRVMYLNSSAERNK